MSYRFSLFARKDLKDITTYTCDTWGDPKCKTYIDGISEILEILSHNTDIGFTFGIYKKYPIGKHIVFYRKISDAEILVVRILHQSADVEFLIS
jgi:toxin ParE1/3/4